jgi:hypothetical protein
MQCGEGQFHLGLTTRSTHYAATRRTRGQIIKQRGLADTRFAGHHQCLTLTPTNRRDEPVERVALGLTVNQPHRAALHP